ncbi:hypothetical protein WJX77_003312 [Trebouxia sp. C0004]
MVNFQQGLLGLGVLTVLFGGDIYSMFAGQSSGATTSAPSSLASLSSGGRVHVAGAFVQVKEALEGRFPGIEVNGGSYPVAPVKAAMAQAVQVVQFSVIGIVVLGDKLFPMLGMQTPAIYEQVKDKKFAVGMAAFFFGNMAQSSLTQTGAFEVFYNGALVASKLESSQMPNLPQLVQSIQSAMQ